MRRLLAGASLCALATIAVVLNDRARPVPTPSGFAAEEIEAAERQVLPFRRSGLIFHWTDDTPTVYVNRSMWEALPQETRGELGRAMAVAKNREQITVVDETLTARLAICTARTGCTAAGKSKPADREDREEKQ
jgi:hypothetical protein